MSRVPSLGPRGEGWVALQLVTIAAVVLAASVPPQWPDSIERELAFVGLVLGVVGGAIVLWAGFALGHAITPFTRPRARDEFVETGPYRFVRHPMYAGGLLFFLGVSLLASAPSLVATGLLAVVWGLKAVVEEERLEERFPAYDDYRRRVRYRLAPGLY